ncbi:Hypothetical protein ADP8_03193 (plasmid) [Roseomonas mucosa]|uniref:Domain of uncharacterized function (DUF2825) n=1 Tax=Roseomonas mucosa TaxID=207340 RepID=A0A379PK80_9PROT|nr:Hypothetical protein ADP8_03193 [Roseomonas mucosa]UZO94128.1 Hypothetical protein RMP42_03193b [Roseomonas mucosa]SUE95318.1 Domain of uncharacterised function (DUF2825) [Roseomonas mucosa]
MPIHSWSFWLSVHPRARGEHMVSEQFRICLGGSSPRSRGTRHLGIPPAGRPRFIPALAGNTSPKVHPSVRSAVHPRARGEHGAILSLNGKPVGSSPRSRGTHALCPLIALYSRFIPALAGNTPARGRRFPATPVHPRARGEHRHHRRFPCYGGGSSPRSRGTRYQPHARICLERFIPALAGNTGHIRTEKDCGSVHPRARGEHCCVVTGKVLDGGSSPRSRGTPGGADISHAPRRFIPALAGNTSRMRLLTRLSPVHPRARGEHRRERPVRSHPYGSSPRSRGTPPETARTPRRQRFIPALAGNTGGRGCPAWCRTVHPRARGEHFPGRISTA